MNILCSSDGCFFYYLARKGTGLSYKGERGVTPFTTLSLTVTAGESGGLGVFIQWGEEMRWGKGWWSHCMHEFILV